MGIVFTLHHEEHGQRFKSMFFGHLRPGAPFGLIGQVNVLKHIGVPTFVNSLLQGVGHLSLFADGLDDGLLAFCDVFQFIVPFAYFCYLHLVESTGAFLAVTADERDGASLVQQLQGIVNVGIFQLQCLGYDGCKCVHCRFCLNICGCKSNSFSLISRSQQ